VIPPRAPVSHILAASPKQDDPLGEDVRTRLAQAWSMSPRGDIAAFVLNARARDAHLRQCPAALVMRVARSMGLQFDDDAQDGFGFEETAGPMLKSMFSRTANTAPGQDMVATEMNRVALRVLEQIRASFPPGHPARRRP
jgi:hypothetical protein